jgi:hypothetical protein
MRIDPEEQLQLPLADVLTVIAQGHQSCSLQVEEDHAAYAAASFGEIIPPAGCRASQGREPARLSGYQASRSPARDREASGMYWGFQQMTRIRQALLERPHLDCTIRLHHRKHAEVADAIQCVVAEVDGSGPIIVPLLGPTRCGKTQIFQEHSRGHGRLVAGPGTPSPSSPRRP